MYEKHIMELQDKAACGHISVSTRDAAIALMRAAEPKDEAAERKHCAEISNDYWLRELLFSERAAARAESAGRIAKLEAEIASLEDEIRTMGEFE